MARYSAFLGRRVEVHYRAGDILLPASGVFAADSGRSIFLEQSFVQRGQPRHFRWEIPYQHIVRLEEKSEEEAHGFGGAQVATVNPTVSPVKRAVVAAAGASGGIAPILPLPNRPKTA